MTHVKTLTKVFAQVTQEQLENLAWHVGEGAGICCGEWAVFYTLKNGSG